MVATPFSFNELGEPSSDQVGTDGSAAMEQQEGKCIKFCAHLKDFGSKERPSKKETVPKTLFTAEELAAAVDEARRITATEVEAELRSAMADDLDRRRCDVLAAIRDQVEWHKSTFEQEVTRSADISHQLALSLAQALIPKALERCPLDDISEALKSTLAQLNVEPSIELRMSPDLVECGKDILSDLTRDTGFTGEVNVIADPTLSKGDVDLRWKGGVMDRRLHRLQDQASLLVDLWLADDSSELNDEAAEAVATPSETDIKADKSPSSHVPRSADGGEAP